jgi:hypothetical protein
VGGVLDFRRFCFDGGSFRLHESIFGFFRIWKKIDPIKPQNLLSSSEAFEIACLSLLTLDIFESEFKKSSPRLGLEAG